MNTEQRDMELLMKRADDAERGGELRRKTLIKLITMAAHTDFRMRIYAVENVARFVDPMWATSSDMSVSEEEYVDMLEQALNAVYDACEDSPSLSSPVLNSHLRQTATDNSRLIRAAGYRALPALSEANAAWVGRNADVLLQLMVVVDDDEERQDVQSALTRCLGLTVETAIEGQELARRTREVVGVLCDQFTREDSAIRDLVHSFISTTAVQLWKEQEWRGQNFFDALVAEIPRLSDDDFAKVAKGCFSPGFMSQSSASEHVALSLLPLIASSPLVYDLRHVTPLQVLEAYLKNSRLGRGKEFVQVMNLASTKRSRTMDMALNAVPLVLSTAQNDHSSVRTALEVCKRQRSLGWTMSGSVVKAVENMKSHDDNGVRSLVRDLLSSPPTNALKPSTKRAPVASTSTKPDGPLPAPRVPFTTSTPLLPDLIAPDPDGGQSSLKGKVKIHSSDHYGRTNSILEPSSKSKLNPTATPFTPSSALKRSQSDSDDAAPRSTKKARFDVPHTDLLSRMSIHSPNDSSARISTISESLLSIKGSAANPTLNQGERVQTHYDGNGTGSHLKSDGNASLVERIFAVPKSAPSKVAPVNRNVAKARNVTRRDGSGESLSIRGAASNLGNGGSLMSRLSG